MADPPREFSLSSRPLRSAFHICRGPFCHPLMGYSWSDRTPLHEAAFRGRLLHMKNLIAKGYHANTLTLDRVSPLHEACLGGHYACIKFLLDQGANVQEVSTEGCTPLFYSCCSGDAACVRIMLQHGACIHAPNQITSPVNEAAKRGRSDCLELLLAHGAQLDMDQKDIGTPLYSACKARAEACATLLLRSGADVQLGCGQDTPLHAAVRIGDATIVDLLLDFGADVHCRNSDGKTPLDLLPPSSPIRMALQSRGPSSLSELCRFCIRRSLGRTRLHKASCLHLPQRLTDFLLYQ
ncbi:ankyrin repeat and SOCS box protein 11 [Antennarius striatus]|uniref:ankyrin repeat and SOCS box protein 11 n=1 Tax=Antennarius striatus TaxID=241820 RepID=UPI0035B3CF74